MGIPEGFVAPKSVDWSKKGAVTAVKNQGQCGSCWAFSTTGSLEAAHFLKTGKLEMLSEQQLVDCDRKKDQGCNGGLMDNAFDFIHENKGLASEKAYPYKGVDGTCKRSAKSVPGTTVKKHTDVASNEKALMSAISKQPVSVAIEADQQGFQFYSSGVFSGECGTNLDHAREEKEGKGVLESQEQLGRVLGHEGVHFARAWRKAKGWTVRHPQWPSVVPDGVIGCCCAQFEKAAMRLGQSSAKARTGVRERKSE